MNELYSSLLQLQDLDQQIEKAQARVAEFGPRLQELLTPVTALEKDAELARSKLEELRKQQKKLEHGLKQKQDKLRIFTEKAEKSKNLRDEAATRAEIDFIRRAVEAEEAEGEDVTQEVRRADMKLDDLDKAAAKTREDLQPKLQAIETQREEAVTELKILQDKRANAASRIDKASVRLYDRVRSGKRKTAMAPLTADGACGSCYNVLPPQEQSEIRNGSSLRRCEACGVILYPTSDTA